MLTAALLRQRRFFSVISGPEKTRKIRKVVQNGLFGKRVNDRFVPELSGRHAQGAKSGCVRDNFQADVTHREQNRTACVTIPKLMSRTGSKIGLRA